MQPATAVILALLGLSLIWLPAALGGDTPPSSPVLLSNALASLGLLLLLGLLFRLKRPK